MPGDLNTFRRINGFPIGEDVDILTSSGPRHYTGCRSTHTGRRSRSGVRRICPHLKGEL
jgi:hypothetical protein